MAADMAGTADTADIMANTANILAQYRREADASSAEAGRNSAAANRENTATGEVETGAVVTGAVTGTAATGAAVTDSSLSSDLVIRTTHIGAGAIRTRTRTTAIILRMCTIMITLAPYQESDSLGPDSSRDSHLRTGSALPFAQARIHLPFCGEQKSPESTPVKLLGNHR